MTARPSSPTLGDSVTKSIRTEFSVPTGDHTSCILRSATILLGSACPVRTVVSRRGADSLLVRRAGNRLSRAARRLAAGLFQLPRQLIFFQPSMLKLRTMRGISSSRRKDAAQLDHSTASASLLSTGARLAGSIIVWNYGRASSPPAIASMAIAASASDQCTPIRLPRTPTETPPKARKPRLAILNKPITRPRISTGQCDAA